MLKFTFTDRDTEYYKDWFSFYPKKEAGGFRFTYSPWSYFDPRPQIVTSVSSLLTIIAFCFTGLSLWSLILLPFLFFSWGQIFIHLPWDTCKRDECDYPDYGVMIYSVDGEFSKEIWLKFGKKSKTIYMPWAFGWYKTSLLLKDGSWEDETRGNGKEFWDDKWKESRFEEQYPYSYTLKSGETQIRTATITVQKREWRRYYTPFTRLFNMVRKTIEVEFSDEVGEKSGSWKGGTVGCNYLMKPDETPLQTLQRMARDRKF